MDHSPEYCELKERIVQLDRKLDAWLGSFDKRLGKAEARMEKGKGAKVPKRAVKRF